MYIKILKNCISKSLKNVYQILKIYIIYGKIINKKQVKPICKKKQKKKQNLNSCFIWKNKK